jgi:sporulation protein YlmC with PRC-barrel domain
MAKSTLSWLALAATLSLSTAAIAQTSDQQTVPETKQPAAAEQQTKTAEPVTPPEGIIQLQDKDTFLTSNLMGATVYNSKDEAVGDVNDMIVSRDGKVDGLVIGVGGFLGLGEKDVAIELAKIKLVETDTGIKLVFDANRDELAAAPEFKSMDDMRADNAMDATGEEPDTTRGLMVPEEQKTEEQKQEPQQ